MAIKIGTPLTERRYLGDVLESVRKLEGDCPDGERAWVECRQLTEGEERRVDRFRGALQTRYDENAPVFTRPVDWSLMRRELCKYAVVGVGNLEDERGKPLFTKMRDGSWEGGDAAFTEKWDKLLPEVALAIARVAAFVNPQYDLIEVVGSTLHPDPMILLQIHYPETHEELNKLIREGAEKNLLLGSPPSSDES